MAAFAPKYSSIIFFTSSAFVLRILFMLTGVIIDRFSVVKYTDVDYFVFSDAARS